MCDLSQKAQDANCEWIQDLVNLNKHFRQSMFQENTQIMGIKQSLFVRTSPVLRMETVVVLGLWLLAPLVSGHGVMVVPPSWFEVEGESGEQYVVIMIHNSYIKGHRDTGQEDLLAAIRKERI